MKSILVLTLTCFSLVANAGASFTNSNEVEKMFEKSSLPDFEPWIGIALPGRCFFKDPNEKKTASVLLASQSEDGLMIAPLAADKRAESFFDHLSYSEIVERFPQIDTLKRKVVFNEIEAILFRQKGDNKFEARIREFENQFFVKVILKNRYVRYCYYNK